MKILNFNKLLFFTLITGIVLFSSSCKKDEPEKPTLNDNNLVLTENYLKIDDNYFRISSANNSTWTTDDGNIIGELELIHESDTEETFILIEYTTQNGVVVGQFNYDTNCDFDYEENYIPNIIDCDGFSGGGERETLEDWFDFGDYDNSTGTLTITQTEGKYNIIFNGVQEDGKTVSIKYNGAW